jgi:hypothetical protein
MAYLDHAPIETGLGWCVLIGAAAVMARALTSQASERRSHARKLSEAILGGGLLLLSLELVIPTLPDEVRLPLVVGSIAATATSVAVRRLARRGV